MALAFVSVGSPTTNSSTVTPGLPASVPTDGTGLYVLAVWHRSTTTVPTPTDWTLAGTVSVASGAEAEDAGTVKTTVFYKVAAASDSAPTIAPGSVNVIAAVIAGYSCAAGQMFALATATGTDSTPDTTHSAQATTNPGGTAGDMLVIAYGINGSLVTSSRTSPAFAWSGTSSNTVTARANTATAVGNNIRIFLDDVAIGTGTATGNPNRTWTWNTSAANHPVAAVVYLRIREVLAPVAVPAAAATAAVTAPAATGVASVAAVAAAAVAAIAPAVVAAAVALAPPAGTGTAAATAPVFTGAAFVAAPAATAAAAATPPAIGASVAATVAAAAAPATAGATAPALTAGANIAAPAAAATANTTAPAVHGAAPANVNVPPAAATAAATPPRLVVSYPPRDVTLKVGAVALTALTYGQPGWAGPLFGTPTLED